MFGVRFSASTNSSNWPPELAASTVSHPTPVSPSNANRKLQHNPWDNRIELVKTRPISLLSPREKMPFEVTPFALYLTRAEPVSAEKK
jgi:hypothetical protein